MTKPFTWDEPFQTRSGLKAELIATINSGNAYFHRRRRTVMTEISFTVDRYDVETIKKIGDRAALSDFGRRFAKNHPRKPYEWAMDVTAVHANGCPLDLNRLLEADDFNFAHDMLGIYGNLDRETGRLANHFRPRFAHRVILASEGLK